MQFFDELIKFGQYTEQSVSHLRACIERCPQFPLSQTASVYQDQISNLTDTLSDILNSTQYGSSGSNEKGSDEIREELINLQKKCEMNASILTEIEDTLVNDHLMVLPYVRTASSSSSSSSSSLQSATVSSSLSSSLTSSSSLASSFSSFSSSYSSSSTTSSITSAPSSSLSFDFDSLLLLTSQLPKLVSPIEPLLTSSSSSSSAFNSYSILSPKQTTITNTKSTSPIEPTLSSSFYSLPLSTSTTTTPTFPTPSSTKRKTRTQTTQKTPETPILTTTLPRLTRSSSKKQHLDNFTSEIIDTQATPKRSPNPSSRVMKTPSLEDFGLSAATIALLEGNSGPSLTPPLPTSTSPPTVLSPAGKVRAFSQRELDALPNFMQKQISCADLNIAVGKVNALLDQKESMGSEQYLVAEEFEKEFGRLSQVVLMSLTKSNRLQTKHVHGIATYSVLYPKLG